MKKADTYIRRGFVVMAVILSGAFNAHDANAASVPAQVTGLSATSVSSSQVTLSWMAPSDGGSAITDYQILYGTYTDGAWITVDHAPSTATTTTLPGLSANVIYVFEVAAVNAVGTSTYSDPVAFASDLSTTYVDPNFTDASNTPERVLGVNVFNTIQPAIDAVDTNAGEVDIAGGVYHEDISVGDGYISLIGDQGDMVSTTTGTRLVSPDCNPLLDLSNSAFVQIYGINFNGNDSSHACSNPMISIEPESLLVAGGVTFSDAAVAVEAASPAVFLASYVDFLNDGVALRSDDPSNLVGSSDTYWGASNGPYQASTNPSGTGSAIDGVGGSTVSFRPYLLDDMFSGDGTTNDPPVIAPDQISSLLSNGGTFIPTGDSPFIYGTSTEARGILVSEPVTIDVPDGSGTSSIYIPGEPYFVYSEFLFQEHSSGTFDATQLSASVSPVSAASNIPDHGTAVGSILQWGIPGTRFDVTTGSPISIDLFVGDGYDGQTLHVFRSEALDSGWTQDGLVDTVCTVSGGYCDFDTNSFSYFAAATISDQYLTVYADSATGNDSTGDGSLAHPYKTFTKAYAEVGSDGIISLSGTFDWSGPAETASQSGSGFTVSKNITITGQSASSTFVQASSTRGTADRSVFTIDSGATVTIKNLAIRYGNATAAETGGGITDNGALTLDGVAVEENDSNIGSNYEGAGGIVTTRQSSIAISTSTISDNTFQGRLYGAGGIYVQEDSAGFSMNASTMSGNTSVSSNPNSYPYSYAEPAGALSLQQYGTAATITNVTIVGNSTNAYGGAIVAQRPGMMTVTNSTIVGNEADAGTGGVLYGDDLSGTFHIENTIIADNTGSGGTPDDFYATSGSAAHITDNGHNIVGVSSLMAWSADGDVTGDISGLYIADVLADNSATNGVKTLALVSGSIAIDAGGTTDNGSVHVPSVDERGFGRNGATDIGAFEYDGVAPVVVDSGGDNGGGGDDSGSSTPPASPAPTISVSSGGGSVSNADLAKLLAPGPATTAYLLSRGLVPDLVPGCPAGYACMPIATGTPAVITPFTRDLQVGSIGADVLALQKYLNSAGFALSESGPGSPGHETDFFGALTRAALIKYQKTNGISPAIGYFGPITRKSVAGN